jgi:hypothetical protein
LEGRDNLFSEKSFFVRPVAENNRQNGQEEGVQVRHPTFLEFNAFYTCGVRPGNLECTFRSIPKRPFCIPASEREKFDANTDLLSPADVTRRAVAT